MRYVVFGIAFLWIVLIVWPLTYCLSHHCSGPDLDGFMPAFMLAPIGIPAVIMSIITAIKKRWPHKAGVQKMERGSWSVFKTVMILIAAWFLFPIVIALLHYSWELLHSSGDKKVSTEPAHNSTKHTSPQPHVP